MNPISVKQKLEEDEKTQIDLLRTPEIQHHLDEVDSIVEEWDAGKGEKCERCGKIQSLSVTGWVNSHLSYRSTVGSYYTCGNTSSLFLLQHPTW